MLATVLYKTPYLLYFEPILYLHDLPEYVLSNASTFHIQHVYNT